MKLTVLADKLGALEAAIAPLEAMKAKAEEYKNEIRAAHAKKSPAASFAIEGKKYTATVGPNGNERTITAMLPVSVAIGMEEFLKSCSYTLKNLEARLKPTEVTQLVTIARTGTRTVKTFARTK